MMKMVSSPIFEDYPFQHVGCIFTLVGGYLKLLIDVSPFHHVYWIEAVIEELSHRLAGYPISLILQPVDLH